VLCAVVFLLVGIASNPQIASLIASVAKAALAEVDTVRWEWFEFLRLRLDHAALSIHACKSRFLKQRLLLRPLDSSAFKLYAA
jgi:hypothetical protein